MSTLSRCLGLAAVVAVGASASLSLVSADKTYSCAPGGFQLSGFQNNGTKSVTITQGYSDIVFKYTTDAAGVWAADAASGTALKGANTTCTDAYVHTTAGCIASSSNATNVFCVGDAVGEHTGDKLTSVCSDHDETFLRFATVSPTVAEDISVTFVVPGGFADALSSGILPNAAIPTASDIPALWTKLAAADFCEQLHDHDHDHDDDDSSAFSASQAALATAASLAAAAAIAL